MRSSLLIFLLLFLHTQAMSATGVVCKKYVYLDRSGKYSSSTITTLPPADWTEFDEKSPGFGFTTDVAWVKAECQGSQSKADKNIYFTFDYSFLDEVIYYQLKNDRLVFKGRSGDTFIPSGTGINHRNPTFEVSHNSDDNVHFFRLHTKGSLQAPLHIFEAKDFYRMETDIALLHGAYYGLMASIFIYNILLFLTCLDKIFLIYSIFVMSYFLFQMGSNGYWAMYFDFFWLQNQGLSMIIFACVGMILVFAGHFMQYHGINKSLSKAMKLAAALLFLAAIISTQIPYEHTASIAALIATITPLFVLVVSISLSRRGNRSAKIFTLAWFAYLLGVVCLALKNLGYIQPSSLANNSVQIGSAAEMLLLAVSLGMRLRDLENDNKEQAKKNFELQMISNKNEALAHFSSMMIHDMRAPIGIFERLLLIEDEEIPRMKPAIRQSILRLYSMVDALRYGELENIVRQTSGTFDFSFGYESLFGKARSRGVNLFVPEEKFVDLYLDHSKLERAWINLASNAIEFAKTTVKVEAMRDGSCLVIRVSDDGPGVPQDFLPRLFKRGETFGKLDGTGLGLAYVKHIVEGHGGEVRYVRTGGWTVFECALPNACSSLEQKSPEYSDIPSPQALSRSLVPVAVCLESEEHLEVVLKQLATLKSSHFTFCRDRSQASIVVSNIERVMFEVLESDHQEYFSLTQAKGDTEVMLHMIKTRFKLAEDPVRTE